MTWAICNFCGFSRDCTDNFWSTDVQAAGSERCQCQQCGYDDLACEGGILGWCIWCPLSTILLLCGDCPDDLESSAHRRRTDQVLECWIVRNFMADNCERWWACGRSTFCCCWCKCCGSTVPKGVIDIHGCPDRAAVNMTAMLKFAPCPAAFVTAPSVLCSSLASSFVR